MIGVPTSAGSHHAGQDRAPAALREAGFVSRLQEAGLDVADLGDVPGAVFTPDVASATARSLATVVQVASAVADAVAAALAGQRLPVVLGGDCTITLGVLAGLQRHDPGAALIYFDGDADLGTPQTTSSGVLDAMGIAHLLGLADNALSRLGPAWPMLTDDRLVLVGYDETDPETYQAGVLDGPARADPVRRPSGAGRSRGLRGGRAGRGGGGREPAGALRRGRGGRARPAAGQLPALRHRGSAEHRR